MLMRDEMVSSEVSVRTSIKLVKILSKVGVFLIVPEITNQDQNPAIAIITPRIILFLTGWALTVIT